MRLFLTGATGFVGLNLLLEALRDDRCTGVVAAVRDPTKLLRQLAQEGFDAPLKLRIAPWHEPPAGEFDHAVHCAGVLFARNRDEYFRVNVDDTLRLLGALPAATRVLALSSQSAGGPTPPGRDIRMPADPDAPITWYGESKLAMEKALLAARPATLLWRPPMILGPRDRATLPLFQMAAKPLRLKPGLRPKTYSWIAVRDLVRAILAALHATDWQPSPPLGACGPAPITDLELIDTAGQVLGRRGRSLPIPHPLVRGLSALVDAVPSLRANTPSLTRDRAKEIFADRWVIDGAEFRRLFAPGPFASLRDTLAETAAWYARAGLLELPRRIT